MDIGALNKRVILQKYTEVENEAGEIVQVIKDVRTIWASVEPIMDTEYLEGKKVQAKVSYEITTKYFKETTYKITTRYFQDITVDMQIKYNNRIFSIQDIIDPFEAHKELQIRCIEKEN